MQVNKQDAKEIHGLLVFLDAHLGALGILPAMREQAERQWRMLWAKIERSGKCK